MSIGIPSTPVWTPSFSLTADGSAIYQLNVSSSVSYAPFVTLSNMNAFVLNSHAAALTSYEQIGNSQVYHSYSIIHSTLFYCTVRMLYT